MTIDVHTPTAHTAEIIPFEKTPEDSSARTTTTVIEHLDDGIQITVLHCVMVRTISLSTTRHWRWRFLRRYLERHGMSGSLKDIREFIAISRGSDTR